MGKLNTCVRHVTKPGANLFSELGFEPDEARQYEEELKALISRTLALKEQCMDELISRTETHRST